MSLYGEAERLMRMCVDDEGNPPVRPAPELDNYLKLAQVCATLAVAGELRRFNEGRDQWYREVLEVLSAAKDSEGSPVGSGQPAAAPLCPVCGNTSVVKECMSGDLTEQQWNQHLNSWFRQFRREGNERAESWRLALEEMDDRFGPCPEES